MNRLAFALVLACGCSQAAKDSSSGRAAAVAGSSTKTETSTTPATSTSTATATEQSTALDALPTTLAVNGSLALNLATDASVADRGVQLVDESGLVVAQGSTDAVGAFTIALQTSDLALTGGDGGITGTRLVQVQSLFLVAGQAQDDAVGVKQRLLIAASDVEKNDDDSYRLDAGNYLAKKVGAIVGRLVLETGEDATGTDVYVPGTTFVAKTDGTGRFILGFLPPGDYTVRADRDGYGSIEFQAVAVKRDLTTHLPDASMRIATGPEVVSFGIAGGGDVALAPSVTLELALKGATKFRLSQLSDFRDTVFRPVDVAAASMSLPFLISGADGRRTIYLEVADSDGLSATAELSVLLDTAAPSVPSVIIRSDAAKNGYSNSETPLFRVAHCDDVATLAVAAASGEPAADAFSIDCAAALATGVPISLAAGEGTKSLYVWARDEAQRVSAAATPVAVVLDQTAPTLAVTPASGAYKESIEIDASAGANVDIRYTADLSDPDLDSPVATGKLVIFNGSTLKFRAIDYAGNQSAVVTRNFTIDRDGPILGTIAATTTSGFVKTTTVPLTLSAQGATAMAFAESAAGLSSATWVAYATSRNYVLQSTSDGAKTIHVKFKDDAGNEIGNNGDLKASVTLDTTPPEEAKISLLAPETPTGDFNKELVWTSSLTETVTYEVEVHDDEDYTNVVRPSSSDYTLKTTSTSVRILPLLGAGTYFWRVRATDVAGNTSGWVESGVEKSFTLRILASAFQARRTYQGQTQSGQWGGMEQDRYFGRELALIGDLNGSGGADTGPEIAYSIMNGINDTGYAGNYSQSCWRCGAVEVRDVENNKVLDRIQETGLQESDLFGHRIVGCDLDNDGQDEVVVSAPGKGVYGGANYRNQGAVYAYTYRDSTDDFVLAASYLRPAADGASPYYYCAYSYNGFCYEYGYSRYPYASDEAPNVGDGPFLGWSMTCDRRSGADRLLVGEPGYYDSGNGFVGRVVSLQMTGGALVETADVFKGSASYTYGQFGTAVAKLDTLRYPGCNGGVASEVLAVGMPRAYVTDGSGSNTVGAVALFAKSSGSWSTTACATIKGLSTDPYGIGFGSTLANLGDVDETLGDTTDKLGVGAPGGNAGCTGGGIVRIYGSNTTAALKSLSTASAAGGGAVCDGPNKRFGAALAPAGDFDGDGYGDIAIGAPEATINNQWNSGAVYIYSWGDLAAGDAGTTNSPAKVMTGTPASNQRFGTRFLAVAASGSSLADEPDFALVARPSFTPQTFGAAGSPGAPGTAGGGMQAWDLGAIDEYSTVNMKIGKPFRLVGEEPNAGFGRSIVPLPDIDQDEIADLLVAQPSGRCNSLTWGAASLVSGYDAESFRDICGPNFDSKLGNEALSLGGTGTLRVALSRKLASGNLSYYAYNVANLLAPLSFPAPPTMSGTCNAAGVCEPDRSIDTGIKATDLVQSDVKVSVGSDWMLWGNPNDNSSTGKARLVKFTMADGFIDEPTCGNLRGHASGDKFGMGVSFAPTSGANYAVVGAPSAATAAGGKKGVVYLIDKVACTQFNDPTPTFAARIDANDAAIVAANGGSTALDGFGSYVLALPDLDGVDGSNSPTNYEMFLLIANTNLRFESSTATPQYFVIGVNIAPGPSFAINVLKVETGASGAMLGGFARIIGDINDGGKDDIAIAAPAGTGTYGATGQVRILSGEGLLTTGTAADDVIQVIYNPESAANRFGVAIEYADMTGDGFKDVIIGADQFNASGITNAGALYVFPLVPVQLSE